MVLCLSCVFGYLDQVHKTITSYFVHILEWQTEGLVSWPLGWVDVVKRLQKGVTSVLLLVRLLHLPFLVPGHVGRFLQHVVSMPTRDGHKWNTVRIITNLLDVGTHFLLDFLETGL